MEYVQTLQGEEGAMKPRGAIRDFVIFKSAKIDVFETGGLSGIDLWISVYNIYVIDFFSKIMDK